MKGLRGFTFLDKGEEIEHEYEYDYSYYDSDDSLSVDYILNEEYKHEIYDYMKDKINLNARIRHCRIDDFCLWYEELKLKINVSKKDIFYELFSYFVKEKFNFVHKIPDYILKEVGLYEKLQSK